MWQEPKLDAHQFVKRTKAIRATRRRDGSWNTPGIAFSDYQSMHIEKRKVQHERRLSTPDWAMSDEPMREAVLQFCEGRLYIRYPQGAIPTNAERMAKIAEESKRLLPIHESALVELQARYHREPSDRLAIQVQNFDTSIVLLRRGILSVVTSVMYRYYRLGENATEIAAALQLKPEMVRIWCHRINHHRFLSSHRSYSKEDLQKLFAMRASGKTWKECAKVLGKAAAFQIWKRHFGDLRVGRPHGGRRAWSKEELRKLWLLRAVQGLTWKKIGQELGKHPTTLCRIWATHIHETVVRPAKKVAKPIVARKRRPRPLWTDAKIARLKELRESGKTFKHCAKVLGLKRCQDAQAAYARYVLGTRS